MCYGFGGWLHKSGKVFFIEPDDEGNISHGDVMDRMPEKFKNDEDVIAFEFPDWTIKSFRWDTEIYDWADEKVVIETFRKVEPAWAEYEKVCALAWAEYEKVRDPARAKYEKVHDPARAKYEKVCDPARNRMIKQLKKIDGYLEANL